MYYGKCIRPVVPWNSPTCLSKFIKSVCNPVSFLLYQLYIWRRMYFKDKILGQKSIKVHSMNGNSKDCLYMFSSSSFCCSQSKSKKKINKIAVDLHMFCFSCTDKLEKEKRGTRKESGFSKYVSGRTRQTLPLSSLLLYFSFSICYTLVTTDVWQKKKVACSSS